MTKFEKPQSPDHKFVVAFINLFDEQDAWRNKDGDIGLFTEEEANRLLADEKEAMPEVPDYILPMEEFTLGRKPGIKPEIQ